MDIVNAEFTMSSFKSTRHGFINLVAVSCIYRMRHYESLKVRTGVMGAAAPFSQITVAERAENALSKIRLTHYMSLRHLPLDVKGLLISRFLDYWTLDFVSHLTLKDLTVTALELRALEVEGTFILQAIDFGVPWLCGPLF